MTKFKVYWSNSGYFDIDAVDADDARDYAYDVAGLNFGTDRRGYSFEVTQID